MKDNILYINHIIEAIEKIESYIKGVDLKKFIADNMIYDAVIRELLVIGEAASCVKSDFKS